MAYRANYSGETRSPPQQYDDTPYNPYDNEPAHPTYDQAGYGYDSGTYGGYRDDPTPVASKERDRSVFEADEAVPPPRGPKNSRNLRNWRSESQGNLWTRGSGVWCFGRFFCCTIMIFLFLAISVIISLALWIRPPNVVVNEPTISSTNPVNLTSNGLTVNLDVNVSVSNPNYLSVNLKTVTADLFYPLSGNETAIGSGTAKNIDFRSDKQTNFTLPIALQYNMTNDPGFKILISLAGKCGIIPGQASSDITVDYKIILDMRVLLIPVKPTINSNFNFACPLSASEIGDLLKSAGLDLSGLGGLL
ncbi:hypothetical protein BKA93DRAFT_820476 [Sparassis latifolia]